MEEDIGERVINKLNELDALIVEKLEKKSSQKKNSQLHIMIETEVIEEMKKRAEEKGISLSEWCRKKIKEDSQLDRIENKLDLILNNK